MQNLLVNLWYGQLNPFENSAKNDPQTENLIRLIEKNQDKLDSLLDTDGKKLLDKYAHCYCEYTNAIAEHAFCDVFSLACRLLTEALTPK